MSFRRSSKRHRNRRSFRSSSHFSPRRRSNFRRYRRRSKPGLYFLGTKFSMLALAVLGVLAYLFTPLKSFVDGFIKKV